jgi:leucyl aminopeptidase
MNISIVNKLDGSSKYDRYITFSSKNKHANVHIESFLDVWNIKRHIRNISDDKIIVFDVNDVDPKHKKGLMNRIVQSMYTFCFYKTSCPTQPSSLIFVDRSFKKDCRHDVQTEFYIATFVRDISNQVSNKMTPSDFCITAQKMFAHHPNIKVTIMDEHDLAQQGMNLILATGAGSVNSPRLLVVETLHNDRTIDSICVVGKGVTYDSGGYNLKSKSAMYGMHLDKTGGAICLGLMKYFSKFLHLKKKIVIVIPLIENGISHNAIKPGDVITSYSGKTVEIVDTDAEGRLILADAISFACQKYKPKTIIDIATLTSWSSRAHCHTSYVYFTLNEILARVVNHIGEKECERSLRLPAWAEYMKLTKSHIADVKNYGFTECVNSDGFMASMFLMNFVPPKYRMNWIHFDIKHISTHPQLGMSEGFHTLISLLHSLVI